MRRDRDDKDANGNVARSPTCSRPKRILTRRRIPISSRCRRAMRRDVCQTARTFLSYGSTDKHDIPFAYWCAASSCPRCAAHYHALECADEETKMLRSVYSSRRGMPRCVSNAAVRCASNPCDPDLCSVARSGAAIPVPVCVRVLAQLKAKSHKYMGFVKAIVSALPPEQVHVVSEGRGGSWLGFDSRLFISWTVRVQLVPILVNQRLAD